MIRRLSLLTAWFTAGHAALFGLFWLLLAVPESNVTMLFASALVLGLLLLAFGIVEGCGLLAWEAEARMRDVLRQAPRAVTAAWTGAVVFVIVWIATAYARGWWTGHRGEIDAWLMAEFGSPETGKLHAIAGWLFAFVSSVVGLSLALSVAGAVRRTGIRAAAGAGWLREAFTPRRLLLLTGIVLVFLWLPWQAASYRPTWLSPNWQETLFVMVKLGVLFGIANLGWALALGLGRTSRP